MTTTSFHLLQPRHRTILSDFATGASCGRQLRRNKQTDADDAAPDVLQQVAADVVTARAKARHSVFGIAPVVTYAALDIVDEEEEEYEEEKTALAGLASEAALPPLQSGAALHSVAAHTAVVTK
jgi:hypothetical protein